jgi:outer membrane protein OmpA-like peptidoglycan-associated protein
MKHNLYGYGFTAGVAALVATIGCGSTPMPRELVDARSAYSRAASGDAAELSPGALNDAHAALKAAEKSYKDDDDEMVMRGKAYIALRKAEKAEVLASAEKARQMEAQANMEANSKQNRAAAAQQERLESTEEALARSNAALAGEAARADAERQARIALMNVAKAQSLAIKDEPRGTVITVKVPFKTGKADLPPKATEQLDPLAQALKLTKNREILVEGHTDSQGSAEKNLDLSQKRAESVREYLIEQEVPADKVEATGVGENMPPDTNDTAEGRANNRVVQIVVKSRGQAPNQSE